MLNFYFWSTIFLIMPCFKKNIINITSIFQNSLEIRQVNAFEAFQQFIMKYNFSINLVPNNHPIYFQGQLSPHFIFYPWNHINRSFYYFKKSKINFPYKLNSGTVRRPEARRGRYISDIIPLRRAITTIYSIYI